VRERSSILDTDPITLKEASEIFLRGIVSVIALRAEVRGGNLVVERIGKNVYPTPKLLQDMREKCRDKPNHHAARRIRKGNAPEFTWNESDSRLKDELKD
jgi:hypothetical protein